MNGTHLIGTSNREALYCGHRIWDAYTNAAQKQVQPGGSVTVREEWTNKETGEHEHRLVEYRIDPEHGDLRAAREALTGMKCGEPVHLEVGTIESASGRSTWRNVLTVKAAKLAAVASAKSA